MTKKTKSITKGVMKKTKLLMGKANKKASRAAKAFKKEWKREQPRREEYKKELKNAVNKTLESGIKIGGDVFEIIKKDVNEIKGRDKNKNK